MMLALALTVPIMAWVWAFLRRYVIEDWAALPSFLSLIPVAMILWAVLCATLDALHVMGKVSEDDPPK